MSISKKTGIATLLLLGFGVCYSTAADQTTSDTAPTSSPVIAQATSPATKPTTATHSNSHADRIYGKITSYDGETYEGFIRWDKNESHWFDVLNGTKELDRRQQREIRQRAREEARRSTRNNRNDESWGTDWAFSFSSSAESGIRFGNIKKLEAEGDDEALLTLKNGETVRFTGGSSDIGTDMRELLIEDMDEGELELSWDDIETVEFMQAPATAISRWGQRLYGTVTTRRGQQLTGQITWDVDEVFSDDLLEGEDHDRSRKFRFDRISKITRYSSSASVITLKNGDEVTLRGSNDIDDGNRGIIVSDPTFGDAKVEWSNFESLELKDPVPGASYNSFAPSKKLHGTVTVEGGDTYTGEIRWDNDETASWELLDGNTRDITYDIELGLIASIERKALRSVVVTLKSGKSIELRGSNDVDEGNKGIIVMTPGGRDEVIIWEDFVKVVFDK